MNKKGSNKRKLTPEPTNEERSPNQGLQQEDQSEDPYSLFLFAMRSPKTREKCVGRLRMFFDFTKIIEGPIERRCLVFYKRATEDNRWAHRGVIQYLQKQKERYEGKEITAGTLKNCFQAIIIVK